MKRKYQDLVFSLKQSSGLINNKSLRNCGKRADEKGYPQSIRLDFWFYFGATTTSPANSRRFPG
jgi:hypothetical protein